MYEKWPFMMALLLAWLSTDLLIPIIRRFAYSFGKVDNPGTRKIHRNPIPRVGGIAICLGFFIALMGIQVFDPTFFNQFQTEWKGILYGGLIIFFVGLLDDFINLAPRAKLLGQFIAALTAYSFGVKIFFITNPFGGIILFPEWVSFVITIVWLVGISNTVNLIDGLDGLAAGVTTIAGTTLFIIAIQKGQPLSALIAIALVGGTVGFLRYNFNPAKIFMGDCGSLFLGFMLASLSITGVMKVAATVAVFMPLLILGIPIFDTTFAIIRRVANKRPIFQADQGHLHHRLLRIGFSQRRAVLLIYGISALFGGIALHLTDFAQANVLIIVSILLILWGAVDFRSFFAKRQPPKARDY